MHICFEIFGSISLLIVPCLYVVIIRANGQSPSSKEHRMIYGRTQGKKPDMVVCRIIEKGNMKNHVLLKRNIFQSQEIVIMGGIISIKLLFSVKEV